MDQTATQKGTAPAERLDAALRFARRAHHGQRRKQNGNPYIEHPIAVQELLAARGFDGSVLAAAYLHDTVEKTEVELTELEREFGSEIAELVEALSEDPSVDAYAERKRALRRQAIEHGRESTVLYAADRLSNLRDWRELSDEQRHGAAERLGTTLEERLLLWDEDLDELNRIEGELPFLEEVELELRALRSGA